MDRELPPGAEIVVVGYRNQYDPQLGQGSSVSCLRSSLSFLRLIFSNGLTSTLTADSLDGILIEAQTWTLSSKNPGHPPTMCSIVELPNKITYDDTERALCCVFSRIYGECSFYTAPGAGFLNTQITARSFFDNVWGPRVESYTLVIIGAIGISIYRSGDTAYIFDPHGRENISQAFVVKLSSSDVYAYIAGYAQIDPESQWSAAMVFFVTAGPQPTNSEELTTAVASLYGISETYFIDEDYVERSVASAHPLGRNPPRLTTILVGEGQSTQSTITTNRHYGGQSWRDALTTRDRGGDNGTTPDISTVNPFSKSLGIGPRQKRQSLPKRRRPAWTPHTSSENVTIDDSSTDSGKPAPKKYRSRRPATLTGSAVTDPSIHSNQDSQPDDALNTRSGPSDPIDLITCFRNRKPPIILDVDGAASDDLIQNIDDLESDMAGLEVQMSHLDTLVIECIDSTVWIHNAPTHDEGDSDPLEHFIVLIAERLLGFLIENGTKTRSDSPCALESLYTRVLDLIPVYTESVDILRTTGLVLTNLSLDDSLLSSLQNTGSFMGIIILAKLRMVALAIQTSTEEIYLELDKLENDLKVGDINSLKLYTHLAERLMDALTHQSTRLFTKSIDGRTQPLVKRVNSLFQRARAKEARAVHSNAALARDIDALESAIHTAHDRFDAVEILQPTIASGVEEVTRLAESLDRSKIPDRLSKVVDKVKIMINDAIREYFLRGAQYSARAILMDKTGACRFQIAGAATMGLERMVTSIPLIDKTIQSIIASANTPVQTPFECINTLHNTSLLRDLLQTGKNLSTDGALVSWVALLSDALDGGHINRKEFDNLIKDINMINERASKAASLGTELELFRVLSTAVEQAAKDASDSDLTSIDTVIRGADEVMRQVKVLDEHITKGRLTGESKAQVEIKRREIETLAQAARNRILTIKARRDEIYSQLKTLLLPLAGFVGLRAAPGAIEKLMLDAHAKTPEEFRLVIADAPKSTLTTIHSHLWSLFNQYREAIERPSATTSSSLLGLGRAFATVIEFILDPTQQHTTHQFFIRCADQLTAAIGSATAAPDSETAIRGVIAAVDEAVQTVSIGGQIITEFTFLEVISEKYKNRLETLIEVKQVESTKRTLIDTTRTLVETVTRLKSTQADVTTPDIDMVLTQGRQVLSKASSTIHNGDLLLLKSMVVDSPSVMKARQDLLHLVDIAKQRVCDLEMGLTDLEKRRLVRQEDMTRERWRIDMHAALDKIETQSSFDVVELVRLRDMAAGHAYNTHDFRKHAERALAANTHRALNVIEEVLKFNPYAPENINLTIHPMIQLLHAITWWDEFAVAAPVLTTLFHGIDVDSLLRLMRIASGMITFSGVNGGHLKPNDLITHMIFDLMQVPQLVKYVEYYRKAYLVFEEERDHLSKLRADVLQAIGSRSSEIGHALEEVSYVRNVEEATRIIADGVHLHIPSEKLLRHAIEYLETFDQSRFTGSAYAAIMVMLVKNDLTRAKDAFAETSLAKKEATGRAIKILREVVDAAQAQDRDASTHLANLKNLLRLNPPPPSIANSIDKASSAEDLVTQMALFLQTVEDARELDVKAVEWLQQSRSIIDSHPLTTKIDGKGPMEPYGERIDKLLSIRDDLNDLGSQLIAAEAAWNEAWDNFQRELPHITNSSEAFTSTGVRARSLQAAMGIVLGLRTNENYRRLPAKLTGSLDARYAERNSALEKFYDTFHATEANISKFEALLRRIPPEVDPATLDVFLGEFDRIAKSLPKWVQKKYAVYRELLLLRITLYGEYSKLSTVTPCKITIGSNQFKKGNLVEDEHRRLCGRVAAIMGDRDVIYTLREATSHIDILFPKTFLDTNGTPIEYKLCYHAVGEKLAIMLCGQSGKLIRPSMISEPLSESLSIVGMRVMSEVIQLRLGFETAHREGFSIFSRFIRHRRPDWDSSQMSNMAAETYSAILATTLTRQYGRVWKDIRFSTETGEVLTNDVIKNTNVDRPAKSGSRDNITFTLSDMMISLVMTFPLHLVNFLRLDLIRQHEYMAKTLTLAITEALTSRILINTIEVNPKQEHGSSHPWRPLPVDVHPEDISHGSLFALRASDWKAIKTSLTGLLDVWLSSPDEKSRTIAGDVKRLIPGDLLKTFTVMARMCIPVKVLSSLWTALRPDVLDQQNMTYDDMIDSRLDTVANIQSTVSTIDPAVVFATTDQERDNLYTPVGKLTTFTLTGSPPGTIKNVTAMDIVTCAILLGAPLVVAVENADVFSTTSGLTMCMKLFDSRPGGTDHDIGMAVSSDLSSWGNRLLALDPNTIENVCLSGQLDRLSALVASKPLADARPCLITLDVGSNITHIFWSNPVPPKPPIISLAADELIAEIPFIETDDDLLPNRDVSDPFFTKLISGENLPNLAECGSFYAGPPTYKFSDEIPFPYAAPNAQLPSFSAESVVDSEGIGADITRNYDPIDPLTDLVVSTYNTNLENDDVTTLSIEVSSITSGSTSLDALMNDVNNTTPIIGDWEDWLSDGLPDVNANVANADYLSEAEISSTVPHSPDDVTSGALSDTWETVKPISKILFTPESKYTHDYDTGALRSPIELSLHRHTPLIITSQTVDKTQSRSCGDSLTHDAPGLPVTISTSATNQDSFDNETDEHDHGICTPESIPWDGDDGPDGHVQISTTSSNDRYTPSGLTSMAISVPPIVLHSETRSSFGPDGDRQEKPNDNISEYFRTTEPLATQRDISTKKTPGEKAIRGSHKKKGDPSPKKNITSGRLRPITVTSNVTTEANQSEFERLATIYRAALVTISTGVSSKEDPSEETAHVYSGIGDKGETMSVNIVHSPRTQDLVSISRLSPRAPQIINSPKRPLKSKTKRVNKYNSDPWTVLDTVEPPIKDTLIITRAPALVNSWESMDNLSSEIDTMEKSPRLTYNLENLSLNQTSLPTSDSTTLIDDSSGYVNVNVDSGGTSPTLPVTIDNIGTDSGESPQYSADTTFTRVVAADDLLQGRRYFRNTGIGVLALLTTACRMIAERLRRTRKLLTDKKHCLLTDLHKIRLILG
ncbi:large tegument protein [Felid alphaherpesvirus 1]|nr:large tegument protein [Felid alphaherpesvirus 1]